MLSCEEENFGFVTKNTKAIFFTRWEDNDRDSIKVVGLPMHVNSFLEWFDVMCKHNEEVKEFDACDFE